MIIEILLILYQNFDKMSIGGNVRKYRLHKSLSQEELADKAKVSQSTISSLESDITKPNVQMLCRIAEELEVDINTLLTDEKNVQHISGNATGNIIGNIHSHQVTVNSNFPEDLMNTLLTNQEKITSLLETQNKLIEPITRK